ncbi:MAG: GNAT family N-acetyltransferase [Myxococcales bacterium]|nr:GNAT family N-acetyltransferase [Myxococcales bacterium]
MRAGRKPRKGEAVTTVREAVFSDFESWLPLWKGYQEFYKISIPLEETKITWARFFDPGEPMRAALAFDGTTAVGMVTMIVHRSTWTTKNFAYLEDLYTEPNQRARGVGRSLIEWVRDRALELNCSRLYWHTHKTNERARGLYDKLAEEAGTVEYRMALSSK